LLKQVGETITLTPDIKSIKPGDSSATVLKLEIIYFSLMRLPLIPKAKFMT
jgi:hypothetical protein